MRSHFDYRRPSTPQEAIRMRAQLGEDAKYWAGGTDITLQWQREDAHPRHCIDLTSLRELDFIEVGETAIRIGALTSLATIERSSGRHPHLKTMSDVTKLMCTPQTRSIATIGGNLCNASPAADLSPVLVALDATAKTMGPNGDTSVSIFEFFKGVNRTTVSNGDLLAEIVIPLSKDTRTGSSYRRVDRTVVDIALVNAAAAITVDQSQSVVAARIALGAVAPVILRSESAEESIVGANLSAVPASLLEKAGDMASDDARPISDVRASADYRRAMVKVMTKRALTESIEKLGGAVR